MNIAVVSPSPKRAMEFIKEKYPEFTNGKKLVAATSTTPAFYNHGDMYEFLISNVMNSDEQDGFCTFIKPLLSYKNVVDQDCKKTVFLKLFGRMPSRMTLIIKDCVEKYHITTCFIFICASVSHLPKPILNTCMIVRVPDNLNIEQDKQYNCLDTTLQLFFNNKFKLRDTCLRLSASGISFAEIAKSVIKVCIDHYGEDDESMRKVVSIAAAMEHKSHIVNKDMFVLEHYLNLFQNIINVKHFSRLQI